MMKKAVTSYVNAPFRNYCWIHSKLAPLLATFFRRMFQPLNLSFLKLEKNNFVCNLSSITISFIYTFLSKSMTNIYFRCII